MRGWGACVAGGLHGRGGMHGRGVCMAAGAMVCMVVECAWHGGACMAREGMHGMGAWVAGGGVHGRGHGWQGACVTVGVHDRRNGHCSGRYALYWNAFLFSLFVIIFILGFSTGHRRLSYRLCPFLNLG